MLPRHVLCGCSGWGKRMTPYLARTTSNGLVTHDSTAICPQSLGTPSRERRPRRIARLNMGWLFVGVVAVLGGRALAQQPYPFTLNFEEGNLRGWTATGSAFAFQPTLGDNPAARHRGEQANEQGKYWIGTFEHFQGLAGQRPGAVQGDGPQGTLISAPFVIRVPRLSFLVGGGSSARTRVELQVNEDNIWRTLFRASGNDAETMRRVSWDLSPLQGSRARLAITDSSSGGWGHINVDDFRFGASPVIGGLAVLAEPGLRSTQQPTLIHVPDLIGLRRDSATVLLAHLELRVRQARAVPSARPIGIIIEQRPLPDSVVAPGATVSIVVAAGVPVPDLRGRSLQEAGQVAVAAQFRIDSVFWSRSNRPVGTVLRQSPPPNDTVPMGSPLVVEVAASNPATLAAPMVEVPDLVGWNVDTARAKVARAGLTLGGLTLRPSPHAVGAVIVQRPVAKTRVPSGFPVRIIVAQGVTVPPVIGLDSKRASAQLEAAGLVRGDTDTKLTLRASGAVLGQTPRAGSIVPLNARVSLVIARHVPLGGIGAGAAALAVVAAAATVTVRRGSWRRDPPHDPRVSVTPHPDPGSRTFERDSPPEIETTLRIRGVWDPGVQHLESRPSLVEDDRNA